MRLTYNSQADRCPARHDGPYAAPPMSQSQPSPSASNLASTQAKYTARSPLVRFANRRFFHALDAMVRKIEAPTVLDAGCGEGLGLQRLTTSNGAQLFGVDLDPARAQLAHQNVSAAGVAIADVQQLPFAANSFDLVVLLEVFEHVGSPAAALEEAQRISRRYMLASVPHEPWWRLGNLLRLKYLRQLGNTPEHLHHWSASGFRRFIGQRFKVTDVKLPFLWTFVLAEKRG